MLPGKIWWCEDWILLGKNKNLVLAPLNLHWYHWDGYQTNHTTNIEVQGLCLRSPSFSSNVQGLRGPTSILEQWFYVPQPVLAPPFWSLELTNIHINAARADLVVRGLDLYGESKNPVLAPPDLHWDHWYGYQSNPVPNPEVQRLYMRSLVLSINV